MSITSCKWRVQSGKSLAAITKQAMAKVRAIKTPAHNPENVAVKRQADTTRPRRPGTLTATLKNKKQNAKRKALVGIIDKVIDLYRVQSNIGDVSFDQALADANKAYDDYVEKWGKIGKDKSLVSQDADYGALEAVEVNGEKGSVLKGPILQPPVMLEVNPSLRDAVIYQLTNKGKISLHELSDLLSKPIEKIKDELVNNDLAYPDPDQGWVIKAILVSGDVRSKLEKAAAKRRKDKYQQKTYEALKEAMPEDIDWAESSETVSPKEPWTDVEWIAEFIANRFSMKKPIMPGRNTNAEPILRYAGYPAESLYPSQYISNFENLLNYWLKGVYPVIKKSAGGIQVVDEDGTEAVKIFLDSLTDDYTIWLKANKPEEANIAYNKETNSIVPFDITTMGFGQTIKRFPGMATEIEGKEFSLFPHQVEGVMQYLLNGDTLFHVGVGGGKTFMMFAAAMESRRLGLHRRPMLVTKPTLVKSFAEDFKKLYPGGKVSAIPSGPAASAAVRRINNEDWDLVIMAHSTFDNINVSPEKQKAYINDQLREIQEDFDEEKDRARGTEDTMSERFINKMIDQYKKMLIKLDEIIKKGSQAGLKNIPFESLGVDNLWIDEYHNYKNRMIKSRISELNLDGSAKASALEQKIAHVRTLNPEGRGIGLASATPISNKLTELYTLMKYLGKADKFERWRGLYTEISSYVTLDMKMQPTIKEEISRYRNLRDLLTRVASFSFFKEIDADSVKDRPKKIYRAITVKKPQNWRKVHALMLSKLREPLLAYGIGMAGSVDTRMVLDGLDSPDNLMHRVADEAAAVYRETAKEKGVQILFTDKLNYTQLDTKKNFAFGERLVAQLVKSGIDPAEIALVTGAMDNNKLEKLYEKGRKGEIRVFIATTAKMGEGVNVQKRLKAVHHVDVPWRPSDLEQREGRVWRQGNTFKEVYIFKYLVEGTFSARSWANIQKKTDFIRQVTSVQASREYDTVAGDELSSGEIAGMIMQDPQFEEFGRVKDKFTNLKGKRGLWKESIIKAKRDLPMLHSVIDMLQDELKQQTEYKAKAKETAGKKFNAKVGTKAFTDRKEFATALQKKFNSLSRAANRGDTVATLGGIDIVYTDQGSIYYLDRHYSSSYFSDQSKPPMGAVQSMEWSLKKLLSADKPAEIAAEIEEKKAQVVSSEEISQRGEFEREQEYQDLKKEFVRLDRLIRERTRAAMEAAARIGYSASTPSKAKFVVDLNTRDRLGKIVRDIFPAVRGVNFVSALYGHGPALLESKKAAGNMTPGNEVAGKVERAKMLVTISLNGKFDPENTAYHEAYHLARMLMTPEEKITLERSYSNEEAEAVAFATYMQGKPRKGIGRVVNMAWARLKKMFRSIGSALKGGGYKSVKDIFDDVAMGAIGRRAPLKHPLGIDNLYSAPEAAEKYVGSINLTKIKNLTKPEKERLIKTHEELGAKNTADHVEGNPRMTLEEIYDMTTRYIPNLSAHDPDIQTAATVGAKAMLRLSLRTASHHGQQVVEAHDKGQRGAVADLVPAFIDALKLYHFWHGKYSIIASSAGRGLGMLRWADTPPALESAAIKELDVMRANIREGKELSYVIAGEKILGTDISQSQVELDAEVKAKGLALDREVKRGRGLQETVDRLKETIDRLARELVATEKARERQDLNKTRLRIIQERMLDLQNRIKDLQNRLKAAETELRKPAATKQDRSQVLVDYLETLTLSEKNRVLNLLEHNYADILAVAKEFMAADAAGQFLVRPGRAAGKWEKFVNAYYNFLLSSPETTLVNIVSNTIMLMVHRPLIDAISERLPGGRGKGVVMDGFRSFAMLPRAYESMLHGLKTGEIRHLVGESTVGDPMTVHDSRYSHDIAEIWGVNKAWFAATPQRLLVGSDAFFKTLGVWRVLYQHAHNLAKTKVKPEARDRFIAEFLRDPPVLSIKMAVDHSRMLTYTEPPTMFSKYLIGLRDSSGIIGIHLLPFVRVLWNIMRTSGRMVPGASLLSFGVDKSGRGSYEMVAMNKLKGRKGIKARNDLIAEQIIGLGLSLLVIQGLSAGWITGYGPDDEDERNVWLNAVKPYSMLIGNEWHSYARFTEPFALTLSILTTAFEGLMGRWVDQKVLLKGDDGMDELMDIISITMASVARTLENKTMLTNIVNARRAISGEYKAMWRIAMTFPVPSLVKWAARMSQDGVMYDPTTFKDFVKTLIPGLHTWGVKEQIDIFGDPVTRRKKSMRYDHSVWHQSSTVGERKRMILSEMSRLNVGFSRLRSKVSVVSDNIVYQFDLGPNAYREYQKEIGAHLYLYLDSVVGGDDYAEMDDDGRRAAIAMAVAAAREGVHTYEQMKAILDKDTGPRGSKITAHSDVIPQRLLRNLGARPDGP